MKRLSRNAQRSVARAHFLGSFAVCDTRRKSRQEKVACRTHKTIINRFARLTLLPPQATGQNMKISSSLAKKKDTEGSKEPSVSLAEMKRFELLRRLPDLHP
jgi:hypothetical protein